MLALTIGSSLMKDFSQKQARQIHTDFGQAKVTEHNGCFLLQRHGNGLPPHKINHKANISALKKLGVTKIISINSCGSLHEGFQPGNIVIPHDYINLFCNQSFFDSEMVFTIPQIDNNLREKLYETAKKNNIDVIYGCIYFQTRGPRFETKAEVNYLSKYADIVGMTMGTEATLANEADIPYANLTVVDNYAHGVGELSNEKIEKNRELIKEKLLKYLDLIINDIK